MIRFKSDVAQRTFDDLLRENEERLRDLMDEADKDSYNRLSILQSIPEISVRNKAAAYRAAFEMDLLAASAAAFLVILNENSR